MGNTNKKALAVLLFTLILFIAAMNGLANAFYLYWQIPWLDMPMHFLGGFWIAGVALWGYISLKKNAMQEIELHPYLMYVVPLAFVFTAGLLWEIFEFSFVDIVPFALQNDINDTMSDIFFDVFGGLVASFYIARASKTDF